MKKLQKQFTLLLFVIATPLCLWAQFTVTGTVTGANNAALAGATVKVRNSNTAAATTDQSGRFSLAVPGRRADIDISYIGYKTQTFTVDENNTTLSASLVADVGNLDEVVVTGLGTSLRRANLA